MKNEETGNMDDNLNKEEVIELFVDDESETNAQGMPFEQSNILKKRKTRPIYSIVRVAALIIAAGVLVYSSYSLTDSYLNYKEDEAKYAEINEMFVQNTEKETKAYDKKDMDYSKAAKAWVWDYKAMLEYNDEAKGYIRIDGTRIQYPIVEHSDNDFYLKRGSDKISNGAGAIFLDYRTAGLDGNMCILYGHNMLDGSMFKGMMDYRNSDFCKKHQTVDIYVGYRHYIYYVFSTFSVKATNEDIYKFGFESDSDFQNWINRVYNKSSYKFDSRKPDTSDRIIMCSTCVDDNGNRQIVCIYRGEEVVD